MTELENKTAMFWNLQIIFYGKKKSNVNVEGALKILNNISNTLGPHRKLYRMVEDFKMKIIVGNVSPKQAG